MAGASWPFSTTRIDPRGVDYSWLHNTRGQHADAIGSETEVIAAGGTAVTQLQFERRAGAGLVPADRGADQLGRQEIESRAK
jgi:broad specificity polyphosphatase/5'/3'-nucleotidase SurE